MTARDQGDFAVQLREDVKSMLAELNIDAVLATLEATKAPEPPPAVPPTATPGEERRAARRFSPEELTADLRLTIPGASDVVMVNLSETGAMIQTNRHMRPGSAADIFVRLNGRRHVMRATTVRSILHAINARVVYRTALSFDNRLSLEGAVKP